MTKGEKWQRVLRYIEYLIQYGNNLNGDGWSSVWEDALWRERVKIAPGTGTASSGVPVWAKGKTQKSKSTFHPFYIILILLYISYSLIQFSILKLSYIRIEGGGNHKICNVKNRYR